MRTMYNFCRQLERIIRVAFMGMLEKPKTDLVPRRRILSNDSYETTPIIYKAHPIGQETD